MSTWYILKRPAYSLSSLTSRVRHQALWTWIYTIHVAFLWFLSWESWTVFGPPVWLSLFSRNPFAAVPMFYCMLLLLTPFSLKLENQILGLCSKIYSYIQYCECFGAFIQTLLLNQKLIELHFCLWNRQLAHLEKKHQCIKSREGLKKGFQKYNATLHTASLQKALHHNLSAELARL